MTHPAWKNKTVLIVDDSLEICQKLKGIYTALGLNVIGTVQNGSDALKFLENQSPDIVSLDIIMKGMHGIECYRLIKKAKKEQHCLLISILAKDPTFVDAFKEEIPSQIFISKPLREDQIMSSLKFLFGIDEPLKPMLGLDNATNTPKPVEIPI